MSKSERQALSAWFVLTAILPVAGAAASESFWSVFLKSLAACVVCGAAAFALVRLLNRDRYEK
ncbi:hypothetical protein VX037_18610 [Gordonia sp. Z-3]|uniref:hypothetical protein n=1 Tax=Gordonia sp. Z-3 TaxID=3115408 RepID=UPI002E2A33C6|nr:hypothetical protein [Gordonia sp. Z-3]MED5803040.1 hypothetical protein [Gordonia sp. Z-3]